MTNDLTEEELRLVAKYGSGYFIRAVAVTKLAKRQGRLEELREFAKNKGGDTE